MTAVDAVSVRKTWREISGGNGDETTWLARGTFVLFQHLCSRELKRRRSEDVNICGSSRCQFDFFLYQEKGRALPKFGEWDVNNPASADGFTVIFAKARDEKKAKATEMMPTPPPVHDESSPPSHPYNDDAHPRKIHEAAAAAGNDVESSWKWALAVLGSGIGTSAVFFYFIAAARMYVPYKSLRICRPGPFN
ncbi:protein NOI4 [Sesamum angolense]|uniref:Protein NOI4 n=1 Tax=Sesamum angolense TaxID=2727404 RepID=A0AAE2C5P5_9LAMI|nr:protein NOI4 [Sesamum angolense]